jgi:hypothetical protein
MAGKVLRNFSFFFFSFFFFYVHVHSKLELNCRNDVFFFFSFLDSSRKKARIQECKEIFFLVLESLSFFLLTIILIIWKFHIYFFL